MIGTTFYALDAFDMAEFLHQSVQSVCILYIYAQIALENAVMAADIDLSDIDAEIL
jgi:hypothetical protein